MQEPSAIEDPEMLFDEKDMGDEGRRMYDSVLILELRCNFGPPESAELASVTKELAPKLGPELAAPLGIPRFMSTAEGLRIPDLPAADIKLS